LFVYGTNRDQDVRVARAICQAEGQKLRHVDKDAAAVPTREEIGDVVRLNFLSDDGYFQSGIFNNGAERTERRIRSRHALTMNGGGGEILRVFFQLLDKPYTPLQFAQAFYANVDERAFSSKFSQQIFIRNVVDKIGILVPTEHGKLQRYVIEWLYILFRCRSWFGRHGSIYNWYGASLIPFFDVDIGRFAAGLPIRWKRGGGFEARLIHKIAPRLASYQSAYGTSFGDPISWKRRMMEFLSSARPPALRHPISRFQKNWAREKMTSDVHMSQEFIDVVFKDRDYIMSKYFNIQLLKDSSYKNRVFTLEYLAREFSNKLSGTIV
jgi:hypothetical protein